MQPKNLIEIYNHAVNISRIAGDYILRNGSKNLDIDFKGRADMVTHMDKESETMIVEYISEHFPEHQILGEELTDKASDSTIKWIVDPIDGTTNFVHNHRIMAISIGVEYKGEIIIGVINCPFLDELFTAIRGHGAYLNGKKIEVSEVNDFEQGLFATGFPYELNDNFYNNMELFKRVYESSQGVRRFGAAAIDLCYVACGRFDGFWEFDLNPWDVSAGSLILEEAGGEIRSFSDEEFSIYGKEILGTNKHMTEPLLKKIRDVIQEGE